MKVRTATVSTIADLTSAPPMKASRNTMANILSNFTTRPLLPT